MPEDVRLLFDKEYDSGVKTDSSVNEKETPLELGTKLEINLELDKYGINKPQRKKLQAKILP